MKTCGVLNEYSKAQCLHFEIVICQNSLFILFSADCIKAVGCANELLLSKLKSRKSLDKLYSMMLYHVTQKYP